MFLRFRTTHRKEYLDANRPNYSTIAGLLGFIVIFSLSAVLLTATGHSAVVAGEIAKRTQELQAEVQHRKEVAAYLRMSEIRLQEVQRITRLGFWEWSPDGDEFICSATFSEMIDLEHATLGLQLEQFLSLVHDDDRQKLSDSIQSVQGNLNSEELEYRIERPDGSHRWFNTFLTSINTPRGPLVRATAQDITDRKNKDLELRQSELWQRLARDAGRMGMFVWQPDTGQLTGDDNYYQILGISQEIVSGHVSNVVKYIHPKDIAFVQEFMSSFVLNPDRKPQQVDFRIILESGETRWISSHCQQMPLENNSLLQVIGIMSDITAKKKTEAELSLRKERLKEAQKLANIGSFDWNPQSGEIFWSDEMYRVLGYEVGEIEPSYDAFISRILPADRHLVETKIAASMQHDEIYTYEVRISRPDGQIRVLSVVGRLERNEAGEVIMFTGTNQDITERKAVEQASRLTQARLTEAQKLSLLGAWEWDTQTDALWMSDQFCKNIGLSEGASCTGRQLFAQIHEDDRDLVKSQFAEAESSGVTIEVQHRFLRFATNEERIFTVRAKTHNTVNTRWIFVCSTQDITEQQRDREERQRFQDQMTQMQRLESLGILAGGVAHDFNNLLTGILGNASLAREFLPPESEIQDFLRPIEKSAEHAAQLCHQMLTYAGRGQDLQYAAIDLNSIITDSSDLIKLAASRKANLKILHEPRLPYIDGDAGQIRQILLNLVQNAAEAFPPCGGDLIIRTGTSETIEVPTEDTSSTGIPPVGQVVWIEVSDNGNGMSEATRERIFEPFFTTKFTGRGLGLSTVHGIVRSHNAMMTVTSRPFLGTTFRIMFPVSVTQNPGMNVPNNRTPLPIEWESTQRGKALIVDDDSTIRSIAAFSLAGLGFSIEEASDGQMAINQFTQDPESYSVVVLDLMMPLRDGREVLAAIREYRRDIAVIIISGYSEFELTDMPIGPSLSFLQKPFKAMDLSSLVRRTFMTSHDAIVHYSDSNKE